MSFVLSRGPGWVLIIALGLHEPVIFTVSAVVQPATTLCLPLHTVSHIFTKSQQRRYRSHLTDGKTEA